MGERVAAILAAKSEAELEAMQIDDEAGNAIIDLLEQARIALTARLALIDAAFARLEIVARSTNAGAGS